MESDMHWIRYTRDKQTWWRNTDFMGREKHDADVKLEIYEIENYENTK